MYKEFRNLDLSIIEKEILEYWDQNNIFNKSLEDKQKDFIFYEGPPSANGIPGIHHVIGRTIKDIFCRYKSLQGYKVVRKGGWDTHGLPIELKVESDLGISKVDIGTKISIEKYNQTCKDTVFTFKEKWDAITKKMGYWLDLSDPYITFENSYIESVWWVMSKCFEKNLLYKGYTIQPYSPAAGTGLSSHELNMPGTYKDVTDTTVTACFEIKDIEKLNKVFGTNLQKVFVLAWTTTPWTLPSNTALCIGPKITYVLVQSFNPYTHELQNYILAKELLHKFFKIENQKNIEEDLSFDSSSLQYKILSETIGNELKDISYHQLIEFEANKPQNILGECFKIILGNFVTTEDGTGVVHIAPSFGQDDRKVAIENNIGELCLVDMQGKFVDNLGYLSNRYVKNYIDEKEYQNPDVDICIELKKQSKAFNVQKFLHSYPHCWRTDKPIIYYPLDSWFVKTTAIKDRLIENNNLINWKPKSTGTGRFGQWLENIQDWNLTRSRYWGIPLPIWVDTDKKEVLCIKGIDDLIQHIEKTLKASVLDEKQTIINENYLQKLKNKEADLHKPYIDDIVLVQNGKLLYREKEVIDVWFDSGSMPYAQWNYPYNNIEIFEKSYPADFIAEGVDQTRGWFYTLHVLSTILFDKPAFKNVISNGLVLDKNGEKMSKSKGNVVDPFEVIDTYGADSLRWYIINNSSPWENLKFDIKGIEEVKRKFFGTFINTYSFFALYANIDNYKYNKDKATLLIERNELDRWIISKLNTLLIEVEQAYDSFEPTVVTRLIDEFLDRNLSNWYVRLSRRRFWKNDLDNNKKAAYDTLYECLNTLTVLISPIIPFFSEFMFKNLNLSDLESVHLERWQSIKTNKIDIDLERRMNLAQDICSLVLSLRKKVQIKVRQPLQKILIPVVSNAEIEDIKKVENIILAELNIKEIEYINHNSEVFVKSAKPNFKMLGKKLGKDMNKVSQIISEFDSSKIGEIEKNKTIDIKVDEKIYNINIDEIEISTKDMPGFLVANDSNLMVALDIVVSNELKEEGIAREFVNKIQNYRKENCFNVTDKINISLKINQNITPSIINFKTYISNEVLANSLVVLNDLEEYKKIEINDDEILLNITKN